MGLYIDLAIVLSLITDLFDYVDSYRIFIVPRHPEINLKCKGEFLNIYVRSNCVLIILSREKGSNKTDFAIGHIFSLIQECGRVITFCNNIPL